MLPFADIFAFVKHKVFASYHHANDQLYRTLFEFVFCKSERIFISKSVQIGDIDPLLKVETIRQKIRDEYLRDSTVTVVLIGADTWKRKHVDWEIAASVRQTQYNSRSGLLGIILPSHPSHGKSYYDIGTVPPRLHNNVLCGYAAIYQWSNNPNSVQQWIEYAFKQRSLRKPDNSYPHYILNKHGERWTQK